MAKAKFNELQQALSIIFPAQKKKVSDFEMPAETNDVVPVIEALDGQLITNRLDLKVPVREMENMKADTTKWYSENSRL